MAAIRVTQAMLEVLTLGSAIIPDAGPRWTQLGLEVLTAGSGTSAASADAGPRWTQLGVEILTAGSGAGASAITLSATAVSGLWAAGTPVVSLGNGPLFGRLLFTVSTVTRAQILGRTPLSASAEWQVSGGTGTYTYSWVFGNVLHESGFASTATTSSISRTYRLAGGALERRTVSTTVTDTSGASLTSAFNIYVRGQQVPTGLDGNLVLESQPRRCVWP